MVVNTWPLASVVGTAMVVVTPFGNTTVAVTPWALLGPLLVMLTVTVTVWPGVAAPCGLKVIATSALLVTGVTTGAVLFPGTGSGVLLAPTAVLVTLPVLAVTLALTTRVKV